MQWKKRGLIIEPRGQAPWVGTHAALPVVREVADKHRVYFSSRDARNRSHIGHATLSLDGHVESQEFSAAPVLSPGRLGAFDDAGVTTSCLVEHEGRLFLFYTGWALGVSVPFYLHAGLAISEDEGRSFARASSGPLIDRNDGDPYLTASPWVIIENGLWRMWYVSGSDWQPGSEGPRHRYHIKYAESVDGRNWSRGNVVCIDYGSPDEHAFGRPCVIADTGCYRMWYSYRGASYRMGYAESPDGIVWTRRDDACVLGTSPGAWDSEMVTYPLVFGAPGRRHMLYNGNGYGRTGIGLASQST